MESSTGGAYEVVASHEANAVVNDDSGGTDVEQVIVFTT